MTAPAVPPPADGEPKVTRQEPASASASREDRVLLLLVVGLAIVALGGGWWASRWMRTHQPPARERHLIDFSLTDRTGRTVTRGDLSNQFLVVNFVFTSCSVSCLQVSRHMAAIQKLVADQPDVRLVSLTVDPRTDTPPVLARFADRFGADTNRWLFLTGAKQTLHPLIETSFLDRGREDDWNPMPGGFLDADRLVVVDPSGRVRAYFNGMKSTAPREVAEALNRLRTEKSIP